MHGWGGSIASFLGIINVLSRQYRCIAVDFAGFGETKEPNTPYVLGDYTKDLDALLDELNVKECFFVAHSFGGRVAIDYMTSKRYATVKGAVFADVAGLKPRRSLLYYIKIYSYKIKKLLGMDVSDMGSNDYKALSPLMQRTFVNVVNEYLNKKVHNIHVPVLLVWGEEDRETPLYMAKKLEKSIKESALIVLKGRGHFAYLEENNRFCRMIVSFVEGVC